MKKAVVERFRRQFSALAGLVFILVVIFAATPYETTALYEALNIPGFLLLTIGIVGRLWCTTYIGGRKNAELITDGPYSLWRNPLYVFSFIGMVGIVLTTRILLLELVAIPAFLIYYRFVIRSEERRLEEIFGDTFRAYRQKVQVLLPSFGNYWSRPAFEMNPTFYQRAMADAGSFVVALLAMEAIHRCKAAGLIPQLLSLPF